MVLTQPTPPHSNPIRTCRRSGKYGCNGSLRDYAENHMAANNQNRTHEFVSLIYKYHEVINAELRRDRRVCLPSCLSFFPVVL